MAPFCSALNALLLTVTALSTFRSLKLFPEMLAQGVASNSSEDYCGLSLRAIWLLENVKLVSVEKSAEPSESVKVLFWMVASVVSLLR